MSVKSLATEGAKSNPSKRHRDRLNAELERLANLLPFSQDIVSKLDKLSVLRLSVSYLRAKSFFNVTLKPEGNGIHEKYMAPQPREHLQEGELLLQALNGFVLVITAEGLVFYTSPTIQDYLGFHQSDIIHQSVFELIHTEDRAEFRRQLHWALNPDSNVELGKVVQGENGLPLPITHYSPAQLPPENSAFLERNFVCRLRCLLDNSSGFLAMNIQGRLKFLYEQNMKGKDGSIIPPQLALFAIAKPLQPPSILEIRTKNFIFRTKHKLDFTPMGCDAKGRIVLGYTEAELCMRGSGYQFIHAADMMYCAENHVRMMKTGESGMTVFRLLTKDNRWTWVQANARLGYKNGKPDFIIATQKPLTVEEGEENLQKRTLQLPFNFATGEALLYEGNCTMLGLSNPIIDQIKHTAVAETSWRQEPLDPNSILGAMLNQDRSVYRSDSSQHQKCDLENALFNESKVTELSDVYSQEWEELLFNEDNSIQKIDCIQNQKPFLSPEKNVDFLANNIGKELYNTMKNLDIELEDFDLLSKDETFLTINWDEAGDIDNILLNDEILSYVQESLKKRPDCMYSSCVQEKPLNSNSSYTIQQKLPTQDLQQEQQQQFPAHLQHQLPLQVQHLQQLHPVQHLQEHQRPAPHLQQHPVQHLQEHPVQHLQEHQHPAQHLQQHPAQHLQQHPVQHLQQHPVQHLQEHQHPAQHLQQHPVQHLQEHQHSAQHLQQHPVQHLQEHQHPAQHLQEHPVQHLQEHQRPAPHLQQRPVQYFPPQYLAHLQQQKQPLPVQHYLQQPHYRQQSQIQNYQPQQQLCQKMKLMNVNGLFIDWNSGSLANVSSLDSTSSGFQYKSEHNVTTSACQRPLQLYQQGTTQPSDISQINVPIDGFHTQNSSTVNCLDNYLNCVQDCHAVNPSMDLIASQACYTGAMSMIPCPAENDSSGVGTVQFKSTNSSQQSFLAKTQTGCNDGNSNEVYPSVFNNVNCTPSAPQVRHHHPREPGLYSNQSSGGFI
ncbi:aryl hydrocarbon receptor-like isoform X2 [Narcine bancroftii]|uniref:aryl hydrocarbon receptor-like isoform X2 n=1 Tax=Narcine bancroftii TaxID=1343680 RepID=UPI0038310C11